MSHHPLRTLLLPRRFDADAIRQVLQQIDPEAMAAHLQNCQVEMRPSVDYYTIYPEGADSFNRRVNVWLQDFDEQGRRVPVSDVGYHGADRVKNLTAARVYALAMLWACQIAEQKGLGLSADELRAAELQAVFAEGAHARRIGKTLAHCPYEQVGWEQDQWRAGWADADQTLVANTTTLSRLQAHLVLYAQRTYAGAFPVRLSMDFDEIDRDDLQALMMTWVSKGWLTRPDTPQAPHQVTPTLLQMAEAIAQQG